MFSAMGFLSYFDLERHTRKCSKVHTHLINIFLHWSFEQSSGWAGHPALVLTIKFQTSEMTEHASHRDRAVPPRSTEIKVKLIVLDILISSDCMLRPCSANICTRTMSQPLTVWKEPPDICVATARAIAGFSATQRILRVMAIPPYYDQTGTLRRRGDTFPKWGNSEILWDAS
jgi:hypothetical protein